MSEASCAKYTSERCYSLAKNYRGNRFEVDWSLSATFGEYETPAARVLNIGAGGLCIACPLELNPGDMVSARILDHWGEELHAKVEVIWSRVNEAGETLYG